MFQQHWREWALDAWNICVDSPMAIEATGVYAKHGELYDDAEAARAHTGNGGSFGLPNLHMSRTPNQSTPFRQALKRTLS